MLILQVKFNDYVIRCEILEFILKFIRIDK